jgi:predicted kinase
VNGIIFIGLHGSGQSSFYLQHFYHTHIRLSRDMLKTRHRETLLFHACLSAKQPIVLDNNNPTRETRARYIRELKTHRFEITGYYFKPSGTESLERNELHVRRTLHLEVENSPLEHPQYNEGFDKLYCVNLENQQFIISEWNDAV